MERFDGIYHGFFSHLRSRRSWYAPVCDALRSSEGRKHHKIWAQLIEKIYGYSSDLARTAVIRPPRSEQLSIYNRLVEIHGETIEMARPGNKACDLYNRAKEGYGKRDIPFSSPHAGHGIGLNLHEEPFLTELNTVTFQPNMVICVETRVRWVQKEGYHIEDLVLITEGAPEIMTLYFDGSEMLVI